MPRSRKELLGALLKYPEGSENRLTELFATVLEAHDGFAHMLFERAGIELPDDGVLFETHTQRRVHPGRIPDMLVTALVDGHLRAQLWSEHKTGSGFRDLQLEDYLESLRSQPFDGALIAIVAEPDAEREGPDRKLLTWQEVAELANRAGGTPDWRRTALEAEAPARDRLLQEFIWYLEEEGFAVVDALDSDNLLAFRKTAETNKALKKLLERAGEHLKPQFEAAEEGSYGDHDAYYLVFKLPTDGWPTCFQRASWEAYLELLVSASDDWWEDATGDPAFGAGVTLDGELYEPLASNGRWVAELREAGLGLMLHDDWTRVYRTWPMAKFITAGDTLDGQARALAEWARKSFDLALGTGPGTDYAVPKKA